MEEQVLKRIEGMEQQLKYLVDSSRGWQELKHDLSPIIHDAFKTLMKEFGDVEAGFQLNLGPVGAWSAFHSGVSRR